MMKALNLLLCLLVFNSHASIVTTLPEFKWVVDEITQKDSKVISLLGGNEDPHFVDATPSFMLKVGKADLVIANGLQLEIGWLPKVIDMSGNGKIQFRSTGYCDASTYVKKLQVIENYDRSMGDVHPWGNPHYSISIIQMKQVSKKIFECLKSLYPKNSETYKKHYLNLLVKLDNQFKILKEKLKHLKGKSFMTYHREFAYFFEDFELNSAGTLEKVPGILPSASHLFNTSKIAKNKNVQLVLASNTNPTKYLNKFKEMTGVPFVQLPLHMSSEFSNYIEFQDYLVGELIKNVKDN